MPSKNHGFDGLGADADHAEFIRLFTACDRQLRGYIGTLLPSHADADDVFQRTSVILWKKFSQYRREEKFISWACGVAFYEVRNFLRVQGNRKLIFSDELLAFIASEREVHLEESEDRIRLLEQCIIQLSDSQRVLVSACYFGDQTIKEVAADLKVSAESLYNRLKRIRAKLKLCVEHHLAQEGPLLE